ncbi:membrane protein [Pontibacillus halophilus JSM 076056 = DSM 19796]|uniref:Membrane protein n=1 Tax=Pontibacillus halophilus JSM 076056 = DSM 19796 TaxID=1385510 RepID=A0A0A5GD36_9BACI|nr:DMT family transporter [Pontibacillus halophilus]KGX91126.1 membrane protein [Pontibacillus halophilus JSM 076056 = DSM 19796]
MSRLNLGTTFALLAGVTYGVNSIIVKQAHNLGVSTFDLLFYQFFFATLYFGVKSIQARAKQGYEREPISLLFKSPFNWIAAITAVSTGLLYYSSIQLTDPSVASLGLFQYPWILFLLGIWLDKEAFTNKKGLSILLLWLGSLLLIGSSLSSLKGLGLLYGVAAGASFAVYLFSLKKITAHIHTKLFITLISLIGALFVCLVNIEHLSIFSVEALTFGLLAAMLGQILTFELTIAAAKKIPSGMLGVFTSTELPVAMLLTWIIWGPFPTLGKLSGLTLMFLAIVWMNIQDQPIKQPANSDVNLQTHQ